MHHFLYETTYRKTGQYYVGIHSTEDLEDGYIGSGVQLQKMISLYGKEAFDFQIRKRCETRKEALSFEKAIVTEDRIKDPLCLNLVEGGGGAGKGKDHPLFGRRGKDHPNFGKKRPDQAQRMRERTGEKHPLFGKKRLDLTGENHHFYKNPKKNPMFGTMWITDGQENKTIARWEPIPEGWQKGRKIL